MEQSGYGPLSSWNLRIITSGGPNTPCQLRKWWVSLRAIFSALLGIHTSVLLCLIQFSNTYIHYVYYAYYSLYLWFCPSDEPHWGPVLHWNLVYNITRSVLVYYSRWKFDADFNNSYYLSSSLLLRIFYCPGTMSGWDRAIQLSCWLYMLGMCHKFICEWTGVHMATTRMPSNYHHFSCRCYHYHYCYFFNYMYYLYYYCCNHCCYNYCYNYSCACYFHCYRGGYFYLSSRRHYFYSNHYFCNHYCCNHYYCNPYSCNHDFCNNYSCNHYSCHH